MSNTGGRVGYALQDEVNILELDGRISQDIYVINQERSDRKGLLQLIHKKSGLLKKVHHRRILPKAYDGEMAVVLETSNRFYALCPKCGKIEEILPTKDDITCPTCGRFTLYWLSKKPDVNVYRSKTLSERKPKKDMTKTGKVDINSIADLPDCELWSKTVPFDHEMIDVRAYVLLFTGEPSRKYCFNTYDGLLGKKAVKLYLDEFRNGTDVEGVSKQPWFSIADMQVTRKKLTKTGYVLYKEVK